MATSTRRRCRRILKRPLLVPTTRKADGSSGKHPAMPPAERYQLLRYISHERNGSVNLSRDLQSRTLVAVKTVIHTQTGTAPPEVRILQHLSPHKNLIQVLSFFGHPCKEDWTRIVFEHCEMGDLQGYLSEMGTTVPPEPILWHVLSEVSSGLNHIHLRQIVHGDLKLSSILMRLPPALDPGFKSGNPRFPVLKIADFGNAVLRPRHDISRSHLSTWSYCAPESDQHFGPATDVWALGCMIHQLAHRKFPRVSIVDHAGHESVRGEDSDGSFDSPTDLKDFRKFLRTHVVAPIPIDQPTARSMPRSRLLNYFMMRALDPGAGKRITAQELSRYLPTLTDLIGCIVSWNVYSVTYMSTKHYRPILARFNDGAGTTDSSVVRDVFCSFVNHAVKHTNSCLLLQVMQLLPLLDSEDGTVANESLTRLSRLPAGIGHDCELPSCRTCPRKRIRIVNLRVI